MRLSPADPSQVEARVAAVLDAQAEQWGAPLVNHTLYARRPTLFRAVRGMWSGLAQSGLLDAKQVALVNRRVAALNQCPF